MLKFTGHPLVDVGAAAITAFSQKRQPEQVTEADLERVSAYLEREFGRKYLTGYLTCVFPNSAYVNPTAGPEKKRAFLDTHLRAYQTEPLQDAGVRCGICAKPAVARGFRQHVPMITGEGVLNFFPNGEPGLLLCGSCMMCMAAIPLGALRCSGRALLVHADDPELTFALARAHVRRNMELLQLQGLAEDIKFPDAKQPRTRLIEELRSWASEVAERHLEQRPTSVTAYHLTNSGQGPDLEIYHLPSPIVAFLIDVEADPYRRVWHALIAAARRLNEKDEDPGTHRNLLFDDLFGLPTNAGRFIRTYLLRRAYRAGPKDALKDDPRGAYSLGRELDLVHWELTALFLRKVLDMEQYRVRVIRDFGDRIATYIAEQDRGFWRDFHMARRYGALRIRLINASKAEEKAGRAPLIGFDDFITVFEYGEESARSDWQLARDLVLIRVIEQLHQRRWFAENPEELDVETPEEPAGESAAASE